MNTMNTIKRVSTLLICLLITGFEPCCAQSTFLDEQEQQMVADCYKGYKGAFLLQEVNGDKNIRFNENALKEKVSPVSTFKIFVALVGLESGAIKDSESMEKWDGKETIIDTWKQDHNLRTALSESVNWYFERILNRIGTKKIDHYLKLLHYGNEDASSGKVDFWLDKTGSLRINNIEQVDFLNRLYQEKLPLSKKTQQTVKELLKVDSSQKGVLFGKTGTSQENGKLVLGWFVGFVESDKKAYVFATKVEGENGITGRKAKDISKQILKEIGVF